MKVELYKLYSIVMIIFAVALGYAIPEISEYKGKVPYENKQMGSDTDLEFGRGPNCDGHSGLCSVSSGENNRSLSGSTNGTFYFSTGNILELKVLKSGISSREAPQFADGWFEQAEALTLSEDIMTPLGHNATYTIGAGTYPVTENTNYYIIEFTTVNQNTK
jgi:hypothetical protein